MEKYVKIHTNKGVFAISAMSVAENRADYYIIEKEGLSKGSNEYVEEVDFAMDNNYELIDWVINNTNFEDWENNMISLSNEKSNVAPNDDDFWFSSDNFSIIDYIEDDEEDNN